MKHNTTTTFSLVVVLSLFLLLNVVGGETQALCDQVLDIDAVYQSATCSNGVLSNYIISLIDVAKYPVLYTTPPLHIQWDTLYPTNAIILLPMDTPLNVTLTYGTQQCTKVYTVQHNKTITIQPPKCTKGIGQVTATLTDLCQYYYLDGMSNQFPASGINNITEGQHQIMCSAFSESQCSTIVYVQPLLYKEPIYQVFPTKCASALGSIVVTNPNSYSSIQLFGGKAILLNNSGEVGSYVNLTQGLYFLQVTSVECDTQTIPITVSTVQPTIKLNATKTLCPSHFNYSAELIDFPVDPNPSFSYEFNNNQVFVSYTGMGCDAYLYFDYDVNTFSMKHSVDYSSMCNNGTVLVTLEYNSTYVTGVSINPELSMFNNYTQFWAKIGVLYTIGSACFGNPYYEILVTAPTPYVVEMPHDDSKTSCIYNTTIAIVNYLDFNSMYLVTANQYSFDPLYFYPVNGVFNNIPRLTYNLFYNYTSDNGSSCFSTPRSILLEYDLTDFTRDVEGEVLYANGNCSQATIGLNFNFGNGRANYTNSYDLADVSGVFYVRPLTYCIGYSFWDIPNFGLKSGYDVQLYNNASCNASTDGEIQFIPGTNGYESQYEVLINGVQYPNYNYINLPGGKYNITYTTYNGRYHQYCTSSKFINIPINNPEFKVECSVTQNVTDCGVSGGVITCTPQTNVTFQLGNTRGSSQGLFDNLSSGEYTVKYTSPMCNADIILRVGTTIPTVQILSRILQKPTCLQGDGVIEFSLNDTSSSKPLIISTISYQNAMTSVTSNSSYLPYLKPANNALFYLGCGTCNFSYTTDIPLYTNDIDSMFEFIQSNPTSCLAPFTITVNSKAPSAIEINQISAPEQCAQIGSNQLKDCSNIVNATVTWNTVCTKTYNFARSALSAIPLNFEIVPPSTCNGLDSYYKIKNMAQIQTALVDIFAFPASGILYRAPNSENSPPINYYDVNGCAGTVTPPLFIFNSTISTPGIQATGETCEGSQDGRVVVPVDNGFTYQLFLSSVVQYGEGTMNLELTMSQQQGVFDRLSAGNYTLVESDPTDIHCFKVLPITLSSGTALVSLTAPQCSDSSDFSVALNMSTSNTLAGSDAFTNFNVFVQNSTTTFVYHPNDTIGPIGSQNYTLLFNNTDRRCRRIINASLSQDDHQLEFNVTSVFSSSVATYPANSNVTQIDRCSSGSTKKNLGWIAAIVIGAVVVGAVAAFLVYRRRYAGKTSSVEMDESHKRKSIRILQGGKVTNIDEF